MYRLLIVDDEAGHRAGLMGLMCMLKPEYLVFEAENGAKALQMMEAMSFDLVLSDIRMPHVDGLSFLAAVKSKHPHTRFALLSAYGTFEYARQGLELGADDYLLKPVETDQLRACLDRMEGRLQDERQMERQQEALHHNLLSMQSTYFEQQMYRFVSGELPFKEESEVRSIFGKETSGAVVYARPESGGLDDGRRDNLRFMMRERLKALGAAVVFCPAPDRDAMVAVIACNAAELGRVGGLARECGDSLRAELGIRLVMGACCLPDVFFTRLGEAYQYAHAACLRSFYQPDRFYFEADPSVPPDPFGSVRLDVQLGEVAEQLRRADAQAAYLLFEKPILALAQQPTIYPSKLKEVVMYALLFVIGGLNLRKEERDQLYAEADASVLESRDLAEMLRGLRAFLARLCSAPRPDAPAGPDELTAYVDAHFSEDLSLVSVAKAFSYNPSHFSVVFKQRAGVSFSDYLFELRMQKATQLLCQTNHFAARVGAEVGYPNAAYFAKAFKKRFGMTPDQYRRSQKHPRP